MRSARQHSHLLFLFSDELAHVAITSSHACQVLEHPVLQPVLCHLERQSPQLAAFCQHVSINSSTIATMRAALEPNTGNRHTPSHRHVSAEDEESFSLFGLSLLAKRGLSLLGISISPIMPLERSHAPGLCAETPRLPAAIAELEASNVLGALRRQLVTVLGDRRLDDAATMVLVKLSGAAAGVGRAWEEQIIDELCSFFGCGHAPHVLPGHMHDIMWDRETAQSLARATMIFALWRKSLDDVKQEQ